ncbi:MAG: SpoIIE family protein phosphatase [Nocardiopsaceae bacterium]|nr:SpoIIE family protein phosphatase [Nocardiopsaceae bacterium]
MPAAEEDGRAAQRRLRAGAQLAEEVLAGLDVGAYMTDHQEQIIAVNPRAEELLARPADSFLGENAHDLLHRGAGGRSLPRAQCQLMKAFLSGQSAHGGNKWFTRGDGTILPVVWLISPYAVDEDTTVSVVLFHERALEPENQAEPADGVAALSELADSLSLISETTMVLTSTLEVNEALRRLVQLVTPRLADWAIVDLLSDADELQRVAVVHHREGVDVTMAELEGPLPPLSESSALPLAQVLRGAPSTLATAQDYAAPPDTGLTSVQRELFQKTGMHSAVIAPLRSRGGTVLGALTLGRADQDKKFDSTELALVEDIARRAGLAVDNARLYERQQRVAETMQRYLLPPLPVVDHLGMAARYQPAPHASQVGGDWYDAFLLPTGVTTLVIGDVVGHDLQAASRMSQIRNMLRAFAWEKEEPPSVIVDRLDRAMAQISEARMATMVFARVEGQEGGPWHLNWTNAGHPPPLLVDRGGRARFLEEGHGVLLGTETAFERPDAIAHLPPLSTVVLYTDGMIESPGHSLDKGMARLSRHAAALAHRPIDDFCDQLISRARPDDNDDDIALIALRIPPGRNQ